MNIKAKDNMSTWREHIARQAESELSKPAYCRKYGLKIHQFYYYQRKVGSNPPRNSGFAKVVVNKSSEPNLDTSGIRLFIGRDLCLAMDAGSNLSWVAGLIMELRGSL